MTPDRRSWIPEPDDVRAWLEGLGIAVNQTYRVVIDRRTMAMRVWQFARDDGGAFMEWGGHVLRRIPFDVSLPSIPDFVELDRYGAGPDAHVVLSDAGREMGIDRYSIRWYVP